MSLWRQFVKSFDPLGDSFFEGRIFWQIEGFRIVPDTNCNWKRWKRFISTIKGTNYLSSALFKAVEVVQTTLAYIRFIIITNFLYFCNKIFFFTKPLSITIFISRISFSFRTESGWLVTRGKYCKPEGMFFQNHQIEINCI